MLQDATNIWVAGDNAYVNAIPEVDTLVGAGRSLPRELDLAGRYSYSRFTTKVKRAAIGFDGTFEGLSWGWEGYYQYGETDREQYVNDNRHSSPTTWRWTR